MKIKSIKLKNFRGYCDEKSITLDDLTLIVGKNDIGKSTILEAADIFFGNSKPDKDDLPITCNPEEDRIEITLEFTGFPEEIDIDAGAETNLKEEYLLNSNGNLEIKKIYTAGSSAKPKIFLIVNTPSGEEPLITLKNSELKTLAREKNIDAGNYTASINHTIRKAIWNSITVRSLEINEIEINKEDGKKLYEKLEQEFPIYTLFSADRRNSDQDDEVQIPIKSSIKELVAKLKTKLDPIKDEIVQELNEITDGTIEKLSEMNHEVAQTLKTMVEQPAWEKAFSVNIESDGVPLNKRGSGVKRLVLINFFRQEAERKKTQGNRTDVFYAIEEPETSQHPDWQVKLFEAFNELTQGEDVQIAITSHHPELAGLVNLKNVRFLTKEDDTLIIKEGDETNYKEISQTLGVLPKLDGVKVIVGVEGPNDITFLQNISSVFSIDSSDEKILWFPMGGGTIRDFVHKGYLDVLNLPQVYIFDQDADEKYKSSVEKFREKGHWANLTKFLTIENYLHPRMYKSIWNDLQGDFIDLESNWLSGWETRNIPKELSLFIKDEFAAGNISLTNYGSEKIKKKFAEYAKNMSKEDFEEMGTYNELLLFFDEIRKHL